MRIERVHDAVTDGVIEVDVDVARPVCPAAQPAEPPTRGPVALCGVLNREREFLPNGEARNSGHGVIVALRESPRTYLGHCCSRYQDCYTWKAMKRAEAENRSRVFRGRAALPETPGELDLVTEAAHPDELLPEESRA